MLIYLRLKTLIANLMTNGLYDELFLKVFPSRRSESYLHASWWVAYIVDVNLTRG